MKNMFIVFFIVILFDNCSAVFEKSIANASIDIILPADSLKTKEYTQQFYWEKVTGATRYRLQIAQPSFASNLIQSMVEDTIVTATSVSITLNPGEYEWRVRAENSGSETNYVTRKLYVLQTSFDTRPMSVTLPTSSTFITYSSGVRFTWNEVQGAEEYYIQIDTMTGSFITPLVDSISGSQFEATPVLKKRGTYKWRMYADSSTMQSQYSTTGYIQFAMDTASLSVPANNALNVGQSSNFTWTKPPSTNLIGSEQLTYTINIYNSNTATAPVTTFTFVGAETGLVAFNSTYKGQVLYWSIVVTDSYGVSSMSTSRNKFTLAP